MTTPTGINLKQLTITEAPNSSQTSQRTPSEERTTSATSSLVTKWKATNTQYSTATDGAARSHALKGYVDCLSSERQEVESRGEKPSSLLQAIAYLVDMQYAREHKDHS